jgi:hypothetical protein
MSKSEQVAAAKRSRVPVDEGFIDGEWYAGRQALANSPSSVRPTTPGLPMFRIWGQLRQYVPKGADLSGVFTGQTQCRGETIERASEKDPEL